MIVIWTFQWTQRLDERWGVWVIDIAPRIWEKLDCGIGKGEFFGSASREEIFRGVRDKESIRGW